MARLGTQSVYLLAYSQQCHTPHRSKHRRHVLLVVQNVRHLGQSVVLRESKMNMDREEKE